MLPTDRPNGTYPVDAEGQSLADALTLALDRAEKGAWKKGRAARSKEDRTS